MTITHVLLDIEGTTCPVSFVAEVLFPYARTQLGAYLSDRGEEPEVQALIAEVKQCWLDDPSPEAIELRQRDGMRDVAPYLEWLIDHDIKLTPLKDLQGRIWEAGYAEGALVAPLFEDVPEALKRWQQDGYVLAVYSSGSVPAQHLLYGHTQQGDLRRCFSHWFDTRTGPKQNTASYTKIAELMQTSSQSVLFISDSLAELEAASSAGMTVLFSDRAGNPGRDRGRFERITDYSLLNPSHAAQQL